MWVSVVWCTRAANEFDVIVVDSASGRAFNGEVGSVVVVREGEVSQWNVDVVPGVGGKVTSDVIFEINDVEGDLMVPDTLFPE